MVLRCFTLAVLASTLAACGPMDPDEEAAFAAQELVARRYLGDTTCQPGAADCNVCVNDVVGSLDRGFGGHFSWRTHDWEFTWEKKYPPQNVTPLAVFHDGVSLLGIPTHHVQGFVRTNSAAVPFIVTHSDDDFGGIGRIDSKGRLDTLLRSADNHPTGGQVLGNSFVFAEEGKLRVINVTGAERSRRLVVPAPTWAKPGAGLSGGGLGAVKLTGGGTLVISSTPGGEDPGPRYTLFFTKAGTLDDATPLALVGETTYAQPAGWGKDYRFSENLSAVTECGTGKIYTLHVSGDVSIQGRGYFRLSRVDTVAGKPTLVTLKAYEMGQSLFDCHLRSSGTAFARADHTLGLVCHEWIARRGIFGWDETGSFSYRMTR